MKDIIGAESIPNDKKLKSTTIIKGIIGLLFFTTIASMFFKALEIIFYDKIYSYSLVDIIKLSKDSSSLQKLFELLSYFAKDIKASIEVLLDALAGGLTIIIITSLIAGLLCIFLKPLIGYVASLLGALINGGILLYLASSAVDAFSIIKERLSSIVENMGKLLNLFGANIDFSSNLGEHISFTLKPAPMVFLICLLLIVILSITGLIILKRSPAN